MTQDGNPPPYSNLLSHMSSIMLLQMMEQGGQRGQEAIALQPTSLPDSDFITSNIPLPRPTILTTATKAGRNTARKRNAAPPKKKVAPKTKKRKA
ncbi:hypothetical protein BS78_07G083700 [Paspalum vaginatum]|nr:hypothetical protein BS78_07G083700 [Paspalum vaginatum]